MKRIIFAALSLGALLAPAMLDAQTVRRNMALYLNDGSVVRYAVNDITRIAFDVDSVSYTVSTIAGTGSAALTDGQGTAAAFKFPQGIVTAPDGSYWIVDRGNNAIRRMDADYNVTTVAKSGSVTFSAPWQGGFNAAGEYFVANKALNNIIRIAADGTCSVFETTETFKSPMSVVFDASNNMYVSDRDNKAVKKFSPSGEVTVYDMSSCASGPNCVAVDKRGRIFVGTGGTYRLHMFDTDGTMSTVIGTGTKPTTATYTDGTPGDLTSVPMGATVGMAFDADDNLYIADYTMHTVRVLTPDADGDYSKGTLKTIAGTPGVKGSADGEGDEATFNCPSSVLAAGDTIYVTDEQSHKIRVISINK